MTLSNLYGIYHGTYMNECQEIFVVHTGLSPGSNKALTRVATRLSPGWQQGSHQGGNRALHSVATGLSSGWQQGFSRVDNRALTMVATGLSPI